MLQVLHLDVSKVNRVLHLPCRFFAASPLCLLLRALAGHPPPPTPLPDAGDVHDGVGNLRRKWLGRVQAVPARHTRAESGGGAGRKQDGTQVSGQRGAGSYVRADAHEWSSRHRHPDADVWALVRRKKLSDLKVYFESSVS